MKLVTLQIGFCKYSSTTVVMCFFNIFLFRLDTEGIELIAKFLQVRCVCGFYICASLEC